MNYTSVVDWEILVRYQLLTHKACKIDYSVIYLIAITTKCITICLEIISWHKMSMCFNFIAKKVYEIFYTENFPIYGTNKSSYI